VPEKLSEFFLIENMIIYICDFFFQKHINDGHSAASRFAHPRIFFLFFCDRWAGKTCWLNPLCFVRFIFANLIVLSVTDQRQLILAVPGKN